MVGPTIMMDDMESISLANKSIYRKWLSYIWYVHKIVYKRGELRPNIPLQKQSTNRWPFVVGMWNVKIAKRGP
jgi:hypothetical protein